MAVRTTFAQRPWGADALRRARALVLALMLAATCAPALPALAAGPDSFAPMVRRVLPAVVNIRVTETVATEDPLAGLPPELRELFRDRFPSRRERMQGAGSGFIIDPDGTIVTNNHVIGNADQIFVDLADGREFRARVIGADELTDIAVIKVSAPGPLPYVTWGDSRSVEVGDWVVAAGNPFGLGGTITAGIVSARGRDIGAGPFDDFIQIDAPINPGNSGGPVFNEQGQVIGVDTAIASPTGASVGIGFAIPSEIARNIVSQLRAHGRIERGWLGVSLADPMPGSRGVVIAAVDRRGPAMRAGLRPGDEIVGVDGHRVDSARGVIRAIAQATPGSEVRLTLRRGGREETVGVIVGRRPSGQG
jgi:serine protease Do